MRTMTGRQAFLDILQAAGVTHIFGNPGTTELPLMDVLVDYPDVQYFLTLQEGVAMAMADGYALASGQLGVVNVHVAPGLGNAMGMLYDATKTGAPLLLTAGQQDGRYALTEPLLWGNLVSMVQSMTKWAYQVERVEDLPGAAAGHQDCHYTAYRPGLFVPAHGHYDGRSTARHLRAASHRPAPAW